MNCNKCGTPIIPGENTCRFCGSCNDFSKREPKPEIIGFDDIDYLSAKKALDSEIIDFMIGEDDVSFNEEDEEPIVIIDSEVEEVSKPIEKNEIKEEVSNITLEVNQNVDLPDNNDMSLLDDNNTELPVQDNVVNSIIDEPPTARIPVEEVNKFAEDLEEVEVTMEPSINLDATISMDKVDAEKKEEKSASEDIKEDKKEEKTKDKNNKDKKGSGLKIAFVIVLILLLASVIVNCFLFLGQDKTSIKVNPKNETQVNNYSLIYNNYNMSFPSNWSVDTSKDTYLLLNDETLTWEASINLVSGIDYSLLKDNTQNITDLLGSENYLFTSDYNKTVDNKEFYIFKGKYFEYAVYVIVNQIDDNIVSITDLKFIGEVKEEILDNILTSLSDVHENDKLLLKENFDFKDISSVFINTLLEDEKESK